MGLLKLWPGPAHVRGTSGDSSRVCGAWHDRLPEGVSVSSPPDCGDWPG